MVVAVVDQVALVHLDYLYQGPSVVAALVVAGPRALDKALIKMDVKYHALMEEHV